jgi:HD-GYP domain-containing protein (c-di-GMP phosphodiesterase class II)
VARRIRLRGIGPQVEGKIWESTNRLRVGRCEGQEIVLNDPSVSRRHAEIVCTDQGWFVRDLGSTNGTFLNGVRVGTVDRKMRHRDVVQCGNIVMVLTLLEEDPPQCVETPSDGMQVEASTQNSWEQALEVVAFDGQHRPRAGEQMVALLRAGHHLGHLSSIDELLRSVLEDAVAALDAQHGAILLVDPKNNELKLRACSTGARETIGRSTYSKSLAQRSFSRGESLLCRDIKHTPELLSQSIAEGAMSSIICAHLRSPRKNIGVLHLDRGPLQDPFTREDLQLADALAASVSAGIESAQLVEKQRELFIQTVTALAQAVEMRDPYTGGHTQRVTDYSLMLADELKLSAADRQIIQIGTPLHDIGKIGIDDYILRKPGRLTAEEFELMKTHTVKGAAILETIPDLLPYLPIVRSHHERWDGKGYPDGTAKEQTPRLARLVAVADAFDAMTSSRPYRPCMPVDEAFAQVQEHLGTQFDPDIGQAFLGIRPKILELLSLRVDSQVETLLPSQMEAEAAVSTVHFRNTAKPRSVG